MSQKHPLSSSFRDPSGFVFEHEGLVYRQINPSYAGDYERLMDSGLYDDLVKADLLVAHDELPEQQADVYRIIKPSQVPYISYPYEWSFAQYKAAALLTLNVQRRALQSGMTLKDASAYNVQFVGARPMFIDTLSFTKLDPNASWAGYRQFCQHFLGPLALMSYADDRLRKLLIGNIDGLPLDLVSRALPLRSRVRYSTAIHIHLHARSQRLHADDQTQAPVKNQKMSPQLHLALLASLERAVRQCRPNVQTTEWGNYYDATNYSDGAMEHKAQLVRTFLDRNLTPGEIVHDLGANTGRFSRIAAEAGAYVVAHDIDEAAVDTHYRALAGDRRILPLVQDLSNPSPGIGWALKERDSFTSRCADSTVLALALIHHLAIGNNTPLALVAEFFAGIGKTLIVEFVPKSDSQVKRLLTTREDIFPEYTREGFEAAFAVHYEIAARERIEGTERDLYLMHRS